MVKRRTFGSYILRYVFVLAGLCGLVWTAPAQTAPDAPAALPAPSPTPGTVDRYRIGPGDVLDIRVYNRPQLSRESVRVEGNGLIRMPMIEEEIRVLCLTEIELGKEIEKRYLKYIRRPQVQVFIKEYQSQPVAVLGAVHNPSQFKLQRQVRLLELLSFVGGPSDKAGRNIQVVHTAPPSACDTNALPGEEDDDARKVSYYKLEDVMKGADGANPVVRPGDIVNIAEADQIYVVGNVIQPRAIMLREPLTASRAIAMAGGFLPDTKKDKVRIIRQLPGSTAKSEVIVDMKAVEKRQAQDPLLQPNDIVDVPTSEGRRFLRSLVGGIVPGIGQLPTRVIP